MTAAHLAAAAKQKAKQALEVADAAAQEEHVAMQQYQLRSLPVPFLFVLHPKKIAFCPGASVFVD